LCVCPLAAAKENDTHENMKKIHYANVYDQNGQQRWQQPLHLLPMQIEKICQSPIDACAPKLRLQMENSLHEEAVG